MSARKIRPKSLSLTSPTKNEEIKSENPSPDESHPLTLDGDLIASLPDLNFGDTGLPKVIRPNLTQQIHARSMDKVKKITKQIKKVMTSQESNVSYNSSDSFDDPESSPLVLTSPITVTDSNNAGFSPGCIDVHNVSHDGGVTADSSITEGHNQQDLSTAKQNSLEQRESNV